MKTLTYVTLSLLSSTIMAEEFCYNLTSPCQNPPATYIDIKLNLQELDIKCSSKSLSYIADVIKFDARFLTFINDSSPLTLDAMIKKCLQTKAKRIKYQLGDALSEVVLSKSLLDDSTTFFSFDVTKDGVTFFTTDYLTFGDNLSTLIVRNARGVDEKTLTKKFVHNLSHIETLDLVSDGLESIEDNTFESLKKLKRLNLKNNAITRLNENTFKGLNKLNYLDVSDNNLTALQRNMFTDLQKLLFLSLSGNGLEKIDSDAFSYFQQLQTLDLSNNFKTATADESIFSNMTSLVTLNLSGCGLERFPTKKLTSLRFYNLSKNAISLLNDDTFENLAQLAVIDLSFNNLKSLPPHLLISLKKLEEFLITNNKLTVFDTGIYPDSILRKINLSGNVLSQLGNSSSGTFKCREVALDHNSFQVFPFQTFLKQVSGLKILDLSYNNISSVKMMKNTPPKSNYVEIYLNYNKIEDFVKKPMINSVNRTWKLLMDMSNNRIKCDCFHYEIQKSESETAIFEVTNNENVCYFSYPHYSCPVLRIENCPEPCHCYYTRIEDAIHVDCTSRHLSTFPEISGLKTYNYGYSQVFVDLSNNLLNTKAQVNLNNYVNVTRLNLSHNVISSIDFLPRNVKVLDLSNNQLTLISDKIVNQLVRSESITNISFTNNSWDCSCKVLNFRKYLLDIRDKSKVDTNRIFCAESDRLVIDSKYCENQILLAWTIPLALITLLAVCLALYFRYNTNIKIFLYSRNMCLWWVAEEELDKDKTYDIFISYSHKDEDFIINHLLPELESGDRPFKVCVHFRDFLPGEYIIDSVINSVLESRRTLVVLSNNFMESVWGKMEFKTAHIQAIKERRARVIVVLYGELDQTTLDDDIKTYLKTNTYVQWGDPWFWKKLKYALPHSKIKKQKKSQTSRESFHLH